MRVELSDVGHRYPGGPWLFRRLEAVMLPGRVYALTGPSGSGKSTLLAALAGWITPAAGTVRRVGDGHVGWVFQNPHGSPRRTAADHVMLPLLAHGARPREALARTTELLTAVGLSGVGERQFRRLSGGEAQRLMLARGIAAAPGLLLVDEPTAQLDPAATDHVNAAIARVATDRTVVVVATHDTRTRDACTHHLDLGRYRGDLGAGT